jgi:hypothetical protein
MKRAKPDAGLRPLFRQHLLQFDWCSVESGLTGRGIPDSNYCREGVEGWVEFKTTPGWTVPLRPEQVGWIARRCRHGGRVWVAVRQLHPGGPRQPARDSLWLIPGQLAMDAKAHGLRPFLAARSGLRWDGGPGGWDWRAVAAALVA